jgi:hypothetical protein
MHKTRISAYESYKNLTSLDVELINVLGTIIGVLAIPAIPGLQSIILLFN